MKKIFLLLVGACLMMTANAFADEINLPDIVDKLPNLNQAVIFSIDDNKIEYATTVTIADWKDTVKFDVGYTPTQKLLGLVSIKLLSLEKYISFPILKSIEIEPFAFISVDRLSIGKGNGKEGNEAGYGLGCKIISIKF